MSPYFVWSNQKLLFGLARISTDIIMLYILIRYNNSHIYNKELVFVFAIVSIYAMVGGTENRMINFVPLVSILFLALKPNQQLRIFDIFVTILSIVYAIGLASYMLKILDMNIQLSTAISPNTSKFPYSVYFGHIEESGFNVYRFSSIFDEPGVVGTLNGLLLSVIGISKNNIRSIIILLTGLISFSLAFYVILILYLILNFNFKQSIAIGLIILGLGIVTGDKLNSLIKSRLLIEDWQLAGDNRTSAVFDSYFHYFLKSGGKDLIFGKGPGSFFHIKEAEGVATYKIVIIDYGIIGVSLMLLFYLLCVFRENNSRLGWFYFLILLLCFYQRPEVLYYPYVVVFVGGLRYLKEENIVLADSVQL